MRPIDADKLLARYKLRCVDCEQTQNYCKYLCDLADVISDLEDAPTIEERKKGKWIPFLEEYHDMFKCSNCGNITRVPFKCSSPPYSYCPNCGADMREGQNDEVH